MILWLILSLCIVQNIVYCQIQHFPGGLSYFSIYVSKLKEMRKKKLNKIEGSEE